MKVQLFSERASQKFNLGIRKILGDFVRKIRRASIFMLACEHVTAKKSAGYTANSCVCKNLLMPQVVVHLIPR